MTIRKRALLTLIIAAGYSSGHSQVTVTLQDFQNIFPLDDTVQQHLFFADSLFPLDVGLNSGPNVYDFSAVAAFLSKPVPIQPVSAISGITLPFSPGATTLAFDDGFVREYVVFEFVGQEIVSPGTATIEQSDTSVIEILAPPEIFMKFPMTVGEQWQNDVLATESLFVAGLFVDTLLNSFTSDVTVDGFGTLLLPGGLSFQCLRVVFDETEDSAPFKEFWYVTPDGLMVIVAAPAPPAGQETGIIPVGEIIVFGPVSCCERPGDANGDRSVNIADVSFTISYLFSAGPESACFAQGDPSGDGKTNIADVTYVIGWIFAGGPDPLCLLQ